MCRRYRSKGGIAAWWGAVVAVAVALTAPRIWTSDYPLSYQDTIAPIGEHNGLNDRARELARITARSLKRNTVPQLYDDNYPVIHSLRLRCDVSLSLSRRVISPFCIHPSVESHGATTEYKRMN